MLDVRYVVLILVVMLMIVMLSISTHDSPSSPSSPSSQPLSSLIIIDDETYHKMLDAVTHYSLKSTDHDMKLGLIYLATFHLFDMNYHTDDLKMLDDSLKGYSTVSFINRLRYPVANMYPNIQNAIITHINNNIESSDRSLIHDQQQDRLFLDGYLNDLFRGINIKKD